MKRILVLTVLVLFALAAVAASGVVEGIQYPVVTIMPTVMPAEEPKADLAAAAEAAKAEPVVAAEPAKAEPAPAVVETAPAGAAIAFATPDSIIAKSNLAEFAADAYWRQIVCAPEMVETAADIFGARNVVVLASEEMVLAGVKNGQFLIGILPADAAIPEGCVAQVLNK